MKYKIYRSLHLVLSSSVPFVLLFLFAVGQSPFTFSVACLILPVACSLHVCVCASAFVSSASYIKSHHSDLQNEYIEIRIKNEYHDGNYSE